MGMLERIQTVVESAIVMGASALAAMTLADGFYGFAAACVAVAVLAQVVVCKRTELWTSGSREERCCANCRWLAKERNVCHYCRLEGSGFSGWPILRPSLTSCICWKKSPGVKDWDDRRKGMDGKDVRDDLL